MTLISNILSVWILVQTKWMGLEEVFLEEKFRTQLHNESIQFDGLNRVLKTLMETTRKNPQIMTLVQKPELLDELNALYKGLEMCQKSLNQYLDSKRNHFPRFYFISDDELLSILANTGPNSIQEHIVKMFDNVNGLLFVNDPRKKTLVTAMVSCEKETMAFKNNVLVEGPIENWMTAVLKEMWESNKYLIKMSIVDYGQTKGSRCEWMLDHLAQMCLAANSVWWALEVENVFMKIEHVSVYHLHVFFSTCFMRFVCMRYVFST